MAGPAGRLAARRDSNPAGAERAGERRQQQDAGSVRAQQRAATAGSIITPYRHQRAEHLKPRHRVKHQQRQKKPMQHRGSRRLFTCSRALSNAR